MVNNMVFRWPKPLFFMVLGAHGNNALIRSYLLIGETTQEWNNTLFYSEKNMLGEMVRDFCLPMAKTRLYRYTLEGASYH